MTKLKIKRCKIVYRHNYIFMEQQQIHINLNFILSYVHRVALYFAAFID